MSAPPHRSPRFSPGDGAPTAAASAGSKRRASGSATAAAADASGVQAASAMNDEAAAAAQLSVENAAASSSAAPAAAASAAPSVARKKQRQSNSPVPVAPSGPAISRLYRHALESVFKFCSLKELHSVVTVSREWSAAVVSMPSIRAGCGVRSPAKLSLFAPSRFARHVTEIRSAIFSAECLRIIAEHLPWIDKLWQFWHPLQANCAEAALALSGLRRLKELSIVLSSWSRPVPINTREKHVVAVNHLITAAGSLPLLEQFVLFLLCHDERIIFAPLVALTRLREFTIFAIDRPSPLPSDEQVAALRQMHSLERLELYFTDRNGTLRLLLAAPTPLLRWQSTQIASAASDLIPMLHSLPDLTGLNVQCVCGDVDFLLSLPRVVQLTLRGSVPAIGPADLTRIVTTLQRCSWLTTLELLDLNVTSAHLALLPPMLPRLSRLTLNRLPELASLSFLATDALASSLRGLCIAECRNVSSGEVAHLIGLRSLTTLAIDGLQEPLSAEQKAQIRTVHPSAECSLN